MSKKLYTVRCSINGYVDIPVEANYPEEAISLAEEELDRYDYAEAIGFEKEIYQVEDENGDVVWGMS